jgi:hypothetical protein
VALPITGALLFRSYWSSSIVLPRWISLWCLIEDRYSDSSYTPVPFSGIVHDLVLKAFITVLVQLIVEFHFFHLVTLYLSTLITIMSPIYLKNPSEIINLTPLLTVIAITRLHDCASTYLIFMLIHTPQLHTPWCVDEFLSESWHEHTNDQLSITKLGG